jgi:hypothetical protein
VPAPSELPDFRMHALLTNVTFIEGVLRFFVERFERLEPGVGLGCNFLIMRIDSPFPWPIFHCLRKIEHLLRRLRSGRGSGRRHRQIATEIFSTALSPISTFYYADWGRFRKFVRASRGHY